jgi:phage terminase Nu1 subunit (DNA packaging protein)
LTRARLRKTANQARLLALQVREREGKLVAVEAVLALEQMRATSLRQALLSMPPRLAPRIIGLRTIPEAQDLVATAVNEVLADLSRVGQMIRDKVLARRAALEGERPRRRRARR